MLIDLQPLVACKVNALKAVAYHTHLMPDNPHLFLTLYQATQALGEQKRVDHIATRTLRALYPPTFSSPTNEEVINDHPFGLRSITPVRKQGDA